jgi:hypothetical protein
MTTADLTRPSAFPPTPEVHLDRATHAAERANLHQLERLGFRAVFGDHLELLAAVCAWTSVDASYKHLKRAARRQHQDGRDGPDQRRQP